MIWRESLSLWGAWMRAANRPATTIKLRMYQLRRFSADHARPWPMRAETMIDWLGSQGWSAESMRSYRASLRSFYSWAHSTGRVPDNPAALLPPIRPKRHLPRPAPERVLDEALVRADARVALMVLLAAREGLRRGEIARVHSTDVIEDLAGFTLRVHGKGDKLRLVPLHAEIARLLLALPPGWAFPGQDHGHLSPPYVGKLISRVLGPGWTAHTLRHRFATITYSGSRDLAAVQDLLGHAKPETTRQYVQLPSDALRAAISHAA